MPKQKTPKGAASADASSEINDPRFSSFSNDPRYRLPSKKHTRTKVDKRFSRMLKDEDFSNTAKVDRYGRKLSSKVKQDALKKLYVPDEEEEEDEEESDSAAPDDDEVEKELKSAGGYDAARGGGFSSSEDDSESEDEDGGVEIERLEEFPAMGGEQEGVEMGEISNRIAIVNLDWDNTRAVDLLAVFQSFVPSGGRIHKISVYPSEFGKERMQKEELGPPVFAKKQIEEESEEDSEDSQDDYEKEDDEEEEERIKKELQKEDDGKDYDPAALRQYQLERLRYYYAVMICSDNETAEKIYEATDGTEFGSSANFFDLRFIPDGTEFDDEPRDECDTVPAGFRPTEFITNALQHSKVELTWDKDPEEAARKGAIDRAFHGSRAELIENDVRAYIGSGSDTDEEEAPAKLSKKELTRQKARAAFGLSDEPTKAAKKVSGPVGDMEITFTAGLTSKEKGGVFENAPDGGPVTKEETTLEKYKREEKEKKQRKKERQKAVREGRDPIEAEVVVEEPQEDLGFDDPFFSTDAVVKNKASKSLRKEEREKKRAAKQAESVEKASQHAELELIMQDNGNEALAHLDHFDINEIARTEKKKKRSKKGKEVESKRGGLQEGFDLDVQDPRFGKVFESHEYAIDKSHPRFKGTEGMNRLLVEGRKRRGGAEDDGEIVMKKSKR